jgi:hypothetical protein
MIDVGGSRVQAEQRVESPADEIRLGDPERLRPLLERSILAGLDVQLLSHHCTSYTSWAELRQTRAISARASTHGRFLNRTTRTRCRRSYDEERRLAEWNVVPSGCTPVARHRVTVACLCACLSSGGLARAAGSAKTCVGDPCGAIIAQRFTWFGSRCYGCEAPLAGLSAISVGFAVVAATSGDKSIGYDVVALTAGLLTTALAAYDLGKNVDDLHDGRWLMPLVGGTTGLASIAFGIAGFVRHEQAAALTCGPKGCKPGVPAPVVLPDAYGGPVMMVTVAAGVF